MLYRYINDIKLFKVGDCFYGYHHTRYTITEVQDNAVVAHNDNGYSILFDKMEFDLDHYVIEVKE